MNDGSWSKAASCNAQYTGPLVFLESGWLLSTSEGIEWCRNNGIEIPSVVDEVKNRLRAELGL
ncbi:MAG: hypothetical protein GKR90_27285 [Pseudomonadales bacterium]|nr:hypothetical protein [Pseudomonadales bacterium]